MAQRWVPKKRNVSSVVVAPNPGPEVLGGTEQLFQVFLFAFLFPPKIHQSNTALKLMLNAGQVWLEKKFEINFPKLNYTIKKHLYGSTFEVHCWTNDPLDFKNVTVHMMKNDQETQQLENILKKVKNPSICNQFYIGTCNNASMLVSRNEFSGVTLTDWITKQKSGWEYDKSGTQCIGLGTLLNLFLDTTAGSVEIGIRKDIADFEDIVRRVVRGHPITPPALGPGATRVAPPRVVNMFYELCAMLPRTSQCNSLKNLRDFCFYIYNTPLLWDGKERVLFKDMLWNIKKRNTIGFETMKFMNHPIDMSGWQACIPVDLRSPLYRVLMYNRTNASYASGSYPNVAYNNARGFVDFERNFLVHFQTNVPANMRKVSRVEIEKWLYNILPESCSVAYFGLVQRFQSSASNFFRFQYPVYVLWPGSMLM
ncbi:hypothetical protein RHSIM_RhsimUnG0033500 [Rhododendron simsii]|uniref:Uncharacterized protein n=1 Tax=Rhododendron simsii TaxID=118357 RepID=A0A834FXK6_RHOSS|nr:hypothetical protein RHSIM_RhsimUnG0033500 [Rhododendron simsii]